MSLLFLLAIQAAAPDLQAKAQAARLAESVRLHEEFTGYLPRTLADLSKKGEGLEFWPEGGFWWGPLPKDPWGSEYRLVDRVVKSSREVAAPAVEPRGRGRIIPPNDRLRQYYAARVHVLLAAAAGAEFQAMTGRPPKTAADVGTPPKDPWGNAYEIVDRGRAAVVRVADPSRRHPTLDAEEPALLESRAFPPVRTEDEAAVAAALDRLVHDDYADRKAAAADLVRWGRTLMERLEARIAKEKDDYARRWLREFRDGLGAAGSGEGAMTWQLHLRGLSAVAGPAPSPEDLATCCGRLQSLHKAGLAYALKFGGPGQKPVQKTGSEFWTELGRTDPPLLKAGDAPFHCPCASEEERKKLATSYRGPAAPVEKLGEEDDEDDGDEVEVIGLCDDELHGDSAVILTATGHASVVPRSDPLFLRALEKTRR